MTVEEVCIYCFAIPSIMLNLLCPGQTQYAFYKQHAACL